MPLTSAVTVALRGKHVRSIAILLVMLAASCHSDPAGSEFYGAIGTLTADSQARLTFSLGSVECPDVYCVPFHANNPTWAEDGSGILFSFGPRPPQVGEILHLKCFKSADCQMKASDSEDTCLSLLPPVGGSAYWDLCEERHANTDSIDVFGAAALSSSGQLLFVERTGPDDYSIFSGTGREHSDLWLADPAQPLQRRKLFTGLTGTALDGMTDLFWAGSNQFVAVLGSGLIRGTIGSGGAALSSLSISNGVTHFGLVDAGGTAIAIDGTPMVRRINIAAGTSTTVATLPTGTSPVDISCRPDICLVLDSNKTFWTINPVSGAIIHLPLSYPTILGAKLSPTSGDVVVVEGVNLYLLKNLVPM